MLSWSVADTVATPSLIVRKVGLRRASAAEKIFSGGRVVSLQHENHIVEKAPHPVWGTQGGIATFFRWSRSSVTKKTWVWLDVWVSVAKSTFASLTFFGL